MYALVLKRLKEIFPAEWIGINAISSICINPDDDEEFEKTIKFLGLRWDEISCDAWANHGSVVFLNPEALGYYLPSLLRWAHEDFDRVSLAFGALLCIILESTREEFDLIFSNDRIKCFVGDFLSLIPDRIIFDYALQDDLFAALSLFA